MSKASIVDTHSSRGRTYLCHSPISSGETILVSESYSIGVHELWSRETCHGCLKFGDRKFHKIRCRGCMVVSFCSEECHVAHKLRHEGLEEAGMSECKLYLKLTKVLKGRFPRG